LCITHDLGETVDFERVLVVEGGRIIEDGSPKELREDRESRYRALLDADREVREDLWSADEWRRLTLARGRLEEGSE
jgi:ATP-binding cassette subfamily B protein